jgi:Flp pilus assembly protein TadD
MTRNAVSWLERALGAAAIVATTLSGGEVRAAIGDEVLAAHVRALVLELSTEEAATRIRLANASDPLVAIEQARLHMYTGDCEKALAVLTEAALLEDDGAKAIAGAARGCTQAVAGTLVFTDEKSGSWVRLADPEDEALLPWVYEVVEKTRTLFEEELRVKMPRPVRIELVRDQFSLSRMTGLPLSAARTTGTIGIAKWGRVIMVSPRAAEGGYGFLDTLAHELTHLALARASTDQAPLWLQEGVARRLESRWREESPFDDTPRALDVAAFGMKGNIGPEIDAIGPSIALLPSALEAQVTYAKVQSFMTFFGEETKPDGLRKLLDTCKDGGTIDKMVERASGARFEDWKTRWKTHVEAEAKEIDPALRPGAKPPKELAEARKRYRLGQLLAGRGHSDGAALELARAQERLPRDAAIRGLLARVERASGQVDRARERVQDPTAVVTGDPEWWSSRELLGVDEPRSGRFAVMGAPYDPDVVCVGLPAPKLPSDAARATLCEASRKKPRSP